MTVVVAMAFVGLCGLTVLSAHRPSAPVPDFAGYLERWSGAHEGYDARGTRVLRGWLRMVHVIARPLARLGVQPDVLTLWTVWLALVVVALAAVGGGWAVVAAVLLVASGLGDALDGAVAVLTDRATRWGYVLDSVVDRANDALFLVAAWVVGGPAWLAVAAGVAFGLLEYLRARAGNVGAHHVAVITVGERPSRVICCALAVGSAGLVPARAGLLATIALAVLLALSVGGLAQLAWGVRGELRAP
jgi:CDP-diacylglycerol--glycerol-3-phosphate 3-phosphatidyltransferase